jgi:hypothetical protein
MSSLSVNSVSSSNNIYASTSIAQQKVSTDRADILETETQLDQDKAQLDKDLTYLITLQHKTQTVQRLENTQAQSNALTQVAKTTEKAKESTEQALSFLVASKPDHKVGTNINVYA